MRHLKSIRNNCALVLFGDRRSESARTQEKSEQRSKENHCFVVNARGKWREQGQHARPEHAVPEHPMAADQLGHPAAGQLREDVAPEEAAQDRVLDHRVPLELPAVRDLDLRDEEKRR